jgi:alpha-L-fucosidase
MNASPLHRWWPGVLLACAVGIAVVPVARSAMPAAASPPAALPPLPNADQLAWQESEYALYVRFDLATFTGGTRELKQFNPAQLTPAAWAKTARECGFRRVVLSANDADGFCLWPTKTTEYSVAHTPWHGGRGDLVTDFVAAMREAGLGVGFSVTGYEHGTAVSDDILIAKLRELLSNCGPIAEVRLDGAGGEGTGAVPVIDPKIVRPQRNWPAIFSAIHERQPHTIVVSNIGPDARWNGNNIGHAGEPQWSPFNPAVLPGPELTDKAQLSVLNSGHPDGPLWCPAECFVRLRPSWAWHEGEATKLIAPDRLFSAYCKSTGKNCVLLLNVPLDPTGALPEADTQQLRDLRAAVEKAFAHNLASDAHATASEVREGELFAAENAIDGRRETFWSPREATTRGCWLEVDFGRETEFNLIELREPITLGQRVATYRIAVPDGDGWKIIVPRGRSVGRHKIERFPKIAATKVRLLIDEARACPLITEFSVYLGP